MKYLCLAYPDAGTKAGALFVLEAETREEALQAAYSHPAIPSERRWKWVIQAHPFDFFGRPPLEESSFPLAALRKVA